MNRTTWLLATAIMSTMTTNMARSRHLRGRCLTCRRPDLVLISRGDCTTCWRIREGLVQRKRHNVKLNDVPERSISREREEALRKLSEKAAKRQPLFC